MDRDLPETESAQVAMTTPVPDDTHINPGERIVSPGQIGWDAADVPRLQSDWACHFGGF